MEDGAGVARMDSGSSPWLELAVYAAREGYQADGNKRVDGIADLSAERIKYFSKRIGFGLLTASGPAVVILGGTRKGSVDCQGVEMKPAIVLVLR